MELIFKVYNSKRYGMSESKGLTNEKDLFMKKQQKKSKEITAPVYNDEQRTVLAEV